MHDGTIWASAGLVPPTTDLRYARYFALGDSISIDLYPAHDAELRYPTKASTDRLGAASLLVRNDDRLWPEFRGRDLRTLQPSLRFDRQQNDLTADGATTESLLLQVKRITSDGEPTLVTITAGGNDLLSAIGTPAPSPAAQIAERLHRAVSRVLAMRPNALVIIGTVYDPSDGTKRLPDVPRPLDREAEWLDDYNDRVRRFVGTDSRLRLADIHAHFLGHGLSASEVERWYLPESIIEPNARGASEVRRLWLDIVGR